MRCFCYSGVVPEKINTYVSYSMSVNEIGMDECKTLIKKVDKLFEDITTPYKTDFNLAKAIIMSIWEILIKPWNVWSALLKTR